MKCVVLSWGTKPRQFGRRQDNRPDEARGAQAIGPPQAALGRRSHGILGAKHSLSARHRRRERTLPAPRVLSDPAIVCFFFVACCEEEKHLKGGALYCPAGWAERQDRLVRPVLRTNGPGPSAQKEVSILRPHGENCRLWLQRSPTVGNRSPDGYVVRETVLTVKILIVAALSTNAPRFGRPGQTTRRIDSGAVVAETFRGFCLQSWMLKCCVFEFEKTAKTQERKTVTFFGRRFLLLSLDGKT